jgi:hypothetical protein
MSGVLQGEIVVGRFDLVTEHPGVFDPPPCCDLCGSATTDLVEASEESPSVGYAGHLLVCDDYAACRARRGR